MFLALSAALAAIALLGSLRYGTRGALPLTGLLCLAAATLFNASVGVAPLMGLIAGLQLGRGRSYGEMVGAAVVPAGALCLWLLFNQDPMARQQLAEQVADQLRTMGMQINGEGAPLSDVVGAVLRVQPAIEFVSLLLAVVLGYRVGQWAAGRLGVALPPAPRFALWRPWDELIWVLVAALALGLLGSGLLEDLALNVAAVMVSLYATQGLAVIRFFLGRLGIGRLLELLLYILLFFTSGVSLIALAGLGLLDTWFDWRRLRPVPPETAAE